MSYDRIEMFTTEPGASGPRRAGVGGIDTIVLHYTATDGLPRRYSTAKFLVLLDAAAKAGGLTVATAAAVRQRYARAPWVPDAVALCAIAARTPRTTSWNDCVASVFDSVDADDEIVPVVEFVPARLAAHHVGDVWKRTNQRSIGIEVCYPGPAPRLCKTETDAAAWFRARGWRDMLLGKRLCPDGVRRWFAALPDCVYAAVISRVADHCRRCPGIVAICDHYQFSPLHKIDPDPPLDLALIRERVSGIVGRPMRARPPRA